MEYSVLDLFAGCGGLGLGFKDNGNFSVKLANDNWQAAMDTYVFNNPEVPFIMDDIKNLDVDMIKDYFPRGVDVIIGGPPCQGFSMCGARDSKDERNDLFYEYARIVCSVKPYIFVMENVKGILSMKNKNGELVLNAIYEEFGRLGYNIQHKVVNSMHYEVPQSRERVILIGTRKDLPDNYIYPKHILDQTEAYTAGDALYGLPNEDSLDGEKLLKEEEYNEYYQMMKNEGEIYNHQVPRHREDVSHRMSFVPQDGNWKNIPEEFRVGGIHSNSYRRLHSDKPSITIKHAYKSMIIHPIHNRCLTIREVARLQSFPDNYIFKNNKTSQYQQLANAVPAKMGQALATSVYNFLEVNNLVKNNEVV